MEHGEWAKRKTTGGIQKSQQCGSLKRSWGCFMGAEDTCFPSGWYRKTMKTNGNNIMQKIETNRNRDEMNISILVNRWRFLEMQLASVMRRNCQWFFVSVTFFAWVRRTLFSWEVSPKKVKLNGKLRHLINPFHSPKMQRKTWAGQLPSFLGICQITALSVGARMAALGTRMGSIFILEHGVAWRCKVCRWSFPLCEFAWVFCPVNCVSNWSNKGYFSAWSYIRV